MTEHEAENVRTLFREADLDDVPTSRDLISPAVAWGNGRRRRDRWTAAGVTGVVAAVAVTGVVALRPGGGVAGGTPTKPAGSSSSLTPQEQALVEQLRSYLPAGYRIACHTFDDGGYCIDFTLTSPAGATDIVSWDAGTRAVNDETAPADPQLRVPGVHLHKATAENPLVDGTRTFAGGVVKIATTDSEAHVITSSEKDDLTDRSALVYNQASFLYYPDGAPVYVGMAQSELVKDIPWKHGKSEYRNDHELYGFNTTGPLLSPEQFAKMASRPGFQAVVTQMSDLLQQSTKSEVSKAMADHSAKPSSR